MLRYAVLGSGSSANSYVFENRNFSFLLDCGFSCRETRRRLAQLKFDERNLKFIFLTHIHSDHLKGVQKLSQELKIPVVIHRDLNLEAYTKAPVHKTLTVVPGQDYHFQGLKFTAFNTSHDAPHSLCYRFSFEEMTVTVITDTGQISPEMFNMAADSDLLFVESNYSPQMLESEECTYPAYLKRRIAGSKGHLSNFQTGQFLEDLACRPDVKIRQIYLCHLSKNSNNTALCEKEVRSVYQGKIPYRICGRDQMVEGLDPAAFAQLCAV